VPLASLLLQPAWIFAALLLGAGIALPLPSAAESARLIPPPMLDETGNPGPTSEVAILAGGCFWGVQGVFQHVEGVLSAVSGYAGGTANTAHYEMVDTNTTGHGRDFYPAEDYHQDFLTRNPRYPYIVINDLPKIENLQRLFPGLYRATPVLVAAASRS
jgi:Peptide methionine sulfoxide reductase